MRHFTRKLVALLIGVSLTVSLFGEGYRFTDVVRLPATPVKNQASTGTCWCYAVCAFLESELIRTGKGEHDLAEMFVVRHNYLRRMDDNYLKRGDGNVGQGSLSHMVTHIVKNFGIVPQEVYQGLNYGTVENNHRELNRYVRALSGVAVETKRRSPEYYKMVNALFDIYFGEYPHNFTYRGKKYTPKSFADWMGLNMDDYVELTSFTHLPYYETTPLAIPDNWDHGLYYNVPLDELMATMDYAIDNGYTFAWDGDVSERGFSHANGLAINPILEDEVSLGSDRARFERLSQEDRHAQIFSFKNIVPEIEVTPEIRQEGYETFETQDDHLMQVVGFSKDQEGNRYYITKNSYGTLRNNHGGYLHMSVSYVKAKTIAIMVHKDAIPPAVRTKLGL